MAYYAVMHYKYMTWIILAFITSIKHDLFLNQASQIIDIST